MKNEYTNEKLRLAKIEQAYRDHSRILLSEILKHYTQNQAVAEDILQSTFERVLKYGYKFASFDPDSAFRFLYTIMRHVAYDTLSTQNKETLYENIDEILNEAADESVHSASNPELLYIERMVIRKAIQKLPDDYASIICLHYSYGFKYREIADLLGITENNTIQKCHYIRKKLKEILIKEGFDNDK